MQWTSPTAKITSIFGGEFFGEKSKIYFYLLYRRFLAVICRYSTTLTHLKCIPKIRRNIPNLTETQVMIIPMQLQILTNINPKVLNSSCLEISKLMLDLDQQPPQQNWANDSSQIANNRNRNPHTQDLLTDNPFIEKKPVKYVFVRYCHTHCNFFVAYLNTFPVSPSWTILVLIHNSLNKEL